MALKSVIKNAQLKLKLIKLKLINNDFLSNSENMGIRCQPISDLIIIIIIIMAGMAVV